jgi:hypothetical protein
MYVAGSVLLATTFPTVVLPSAANPPERTVVACTIRPELVVQAERFPDSNPSANSGTAAAGVVADAAGELTADTFPDPSRARSV